MQSLQSTVTLNNGVAMPIFGLGVYNSKEETTFAVSTAIRHGYRLIDTAAFYENEKEVGEGIKDSGIPRDDLFITTKLWNDMQRESRQRESFEKSLDNLGVDAVDLYLIHWPIPGKIKETWHVLEQLYEEGLVKAIGVSNFLPHHLEELSVHANIAPAVDQFECNPYLTRKELRDYCKKHNIVPEAWSPLARGACFDDPVLQNLAKKYEKNVPGYKEILANPAKLQNADGVNPSYTPTAGSSAGDTFTYCKCQDCGNGTWVKDVAAIINNGTQGDTYSTLEAAVKAYSPDNTTAPTNYIKLLHNTTEKTISVNNKNLRLDLNGRTVTGDISVTGAYKLYGMDSTAGEDYVTAPSGKIVGTVKGCAPTYQTPGDTYDCYVAISGTEADNTTANLSFHRFNISVTGYRFELKAPECALFFIGKFQGDKAAKDYLTSLGFTLKDGKGKQLGEDKYVFTADTVIPDMPADGKESTSKVVRSGDAFLFEVYLKRSFDRNSTDKTAYTEKISATAQAMFKNNGTQDSEPKLWSFEDAWKNAEGLTPEQKAILKNFLPDLDFNP